MSLQLYNLPLNPSTTIIKALYGNFTNSKSQQILLAKSKSIELYSISENGKLQLIVAEQLFCILRTVVNFRYQGMNTDRIIIGSDSGKAVILEFDNHKKRFIKTHEEAFGKTGCRRILPGQYIACDPKGRAFMMAAIQKQKFVYVLQRHEDQLSILSPREAHKAHTVTVDVVALDTGSDNAMFVCLQIDYGQVEDKQALINTGGIKKNIVYYEMDFGMNTVIRKKQSPVDPTAHMLIPVPSHPDGPGGVIVVLEDYLFYKNNKEQQLVRFPARIDKKGQRKIQFTAFATYRMKGFFFLISSEEGDIFKVEFLTKDNKNKKQVVSIKIQYFDTVSCLSSMALTKNGYLFCASQKQDHHLYLISNRQHSHPVYTHSQLGNDKVVKFEVITDAESRILDQTDTFQQFGPMTDLKIADLKDDGNPQIYTLNSSGSGKSSLRIIKQGLKVKQLNAIKYLQPLDIWCIKTLQQDEFDKMIIMSFPTKTIVLTTTVNGYSQTKDTGIDQTTLSLHIGRLEDDSLVQIFPSGFRHIKNDKTAKTMKFQGKIVKGITKGRQMALALAGGDIIYYQLDQTGSLSQAAQTSLDSEVVALDFSPIQKGRIRSSFLAVAFTDGTARIFQLSPDSCLKILSAQNMKSQIESIAIEQMDTTEDQAQRYGIQLYLYTGLKNGMIVRTSIDTITGKLTDSRPKYLGLKPVKCVKLQILGKPAILALSSRPWLLYTYGKKQMTTMLAFSFIAVASEIKMPNFKHTVMTFSQNSLKIICLQSLGNFFHSQKIPLDYSGKKLMIFKNLIAINQSDNPIVQNGKKQWKSQITFYNPKQNKIVTKIKFQKNQLCVSVCHCNVIEQNQEQVNYAVVGVVQNLTYHPNFQIKNPCIKVYKWNRQRSQFQFQHSTQIEGIPMVLEPWKQKVLAGVGNCLRLYEIGKKRVLKKAQVKNLNSPVNTIKIWGQRIFATEINDSFHMYKYKPRQQTFFDIADDVLNRYITSTAILDYHTIIGADKFQNIFVSRVPQSKFIFISDAEQDFENNPNSYKFRWENGYLNGAPFKMEQICSFYVGQIVTSIQKASLATSGTDLILYSTINGAIGALSPFQTRQDVDFFLHLQMYVRNLTPSLAGRDHLGYRSYYSPCKSVVDGQLCEVYTKLSYEQQVQIGKHLERTPQQIQKKLQQMRNRIM